MNEQSEKVENDFQREEGKTIDEKIEELLNRGWILLPESCSIPTCFTPLIQNVNGQKYCVGCESWVFTAERTKKQKNGEIVPYNDKSQSLQILRDSDKQIKPKTKKYSFDYSINQSVLQCLQSKLYFLSTLLNTLSDVDKIKNTLETIKICLEDINLTKNLL